MKKSAKNMPENISVEQLAALSGYSARRIRQLGAEGRLPTAKNGLLPFDAVKMLIGYLRRDSEEISREKLLKMTAERRLREHQLDKADPEIISVALAERHAAGFSRQYHERWKLRNEKTIIDAFEVKALELGVPPAIVAILKEWLLREHQKFTDAVEIASEKFAGELAAKLKELNEA